MRKGRLAGVFRGSRMDMSGRPGIFGKRRRVRRSFASSRSFLDRVHDLMERTKLLSLPKQRHWRSA